MYTRSYDREQGLLFALWSGPSNTDEEFQRAADDVLLLDREGAGNPFGVFHIAETEPGNPTPNPSQRNTLAKAAAARTCPSGHFFCMVTSSTLVRGVITALGWFAPRREPDRNVCRASFDQALAWAEGHRPGVSARFHELRREAREAAGLPPA
jgi:hypothetical protein